jgi:hypothetical protein
MPKQAGGGLLPLDLLTDPSPNTCHRNPAFKLDTLDYLLIFSMNDSETFRQIGA